MDSYNGKTYLFTKSGALFTGWYKDTYVDKDGISQTVWYFFDTNVAMHKGSSTNAASSIDSEYRGTGYNINTLSGKIWKAYLYSSFQALAGRTT